MSQAVVDASVAVKWLMDEPLTPHAIQARLSYDLIAPALIHAEVASALLKGVRRGDLESAEATLKMREIVLADIDTVPDEYLCVGAVDLACAIGHSGYDCFYLYLASAQGVPLITADRKLVAAAKAADVRVVPLEDVA